MKVNLPYGDRFLSVDIPEKNIIGIIEPREFTAPARPEVLIKSALMNPIGSDRLAEIATEGDTVAIVVDDYTRPCPTKDMLPPVLDELRRANVRDTDITIIIATGTHKPPTMDKIKAIVGDRIANSFTIIYNDVERSEYVNVGKAKKGYDIEVLREYVESDVKVILGDIEYHYFAGYGGTRKSILPGISSLKTIQNNHKLMFDENARTGNLKDNPVHQGMNDALHLAGCDFAFNVVLNSKRRIVGAWAGDPSAVLDAGIKLVDRMYKVEVKEVADITITAASGYPHDINLYQAHKAIHSVLPVTRKGGVVILVAECREGSGNEIYREWMQKYESSEEVKRALTENFIMGAHKAYYHLKAVEDYHIMLLSEMDKEEVEALFRLTYIEKLEEGIEKAFDLVGKDAKILVVPHGTTTFLTKG